MTEKEAALQKILDKLEASAEKIVNTQGYNESAQRLKILQELIKEQVEHANSRPPARKAR